MASLNFIRLLALLSLVCLVLPIVASTGSASVEHISGELYKRKGGKGGGGDGDSGNSGGSIGGSGGGSSDGSGGEGSGGSSGDFEDYSSTGGSGSCSGETDSCFQTNGYNKFYEFGPGSPRRNDGGFTPDGSGYPPSWQIVDGKLYHQYKYSGSDGDGLYYGGAFEPYTAGKTSPNGLEPALALNFERETQKRRRCTWIGRSILDPVFDFYLYPYEEKFNWTKPKYYSSYDSAPLFSAIMPVYCACQRYEVCGCEDSSGVAYKVVDQAWKYENVSYGVPSDVGCDFTIKGEYSLLIDGSMTNGSTKRKPGMKRDEYTEDDLTAAPCPYSCEAKSVASRWGPFQYVSGYGVEWMVIMGLFWGGMIHL